VAYSTAEVAQALNVSLRQLQHWDERGTVSPSKRSHSRQYTDEQFQHLAVIAELRHRGISNQQTSKIINVRLDDIIKSGYVLIARPDQVIVLPVGTPPAMIVDAMLRRPESAFFIVDVRKILSALP
jgi:DNA-binding transcriptional MerR regulator